jgi:glycosyltransferase involved in cell wall biosynthesis
MLVDAGRSPFTRWATRYVLDRTTLFYADCRTVVKRAAEFGYPEERCIVFPWGVDLELFSPNDDADLRTWLGWENQIVLFSNRSFEAIYGVDLIAGAFVRAAGEDPRLRLLLLGQGSQELLIRKILEDGGVSDRVYFAGQVTAEDLPEYYRAGDLYLSASHSDGSSVSLMEALACGRPALISDIPSNREWITPDETGWLFLDGNADALADGILKAATDGQKRREISIRARKLAEERADWRINSRHMLDGYEKAVTR